MAIISENILQNMFDPGEPAEQPVIEAQQKGLEIQQMGDARTTAETTVSTDDVSKTTTLPPPLVGYKVNIKAKPVGGTQELPYKQLSLYKVNSKYINDLNTKIAESNLNYATEIFQTVNQLPIVNGKQVQLSELSEIFYKESNKKAAGEILLQAAELLDNPTFLDNGRSFQLSVDSLNAAKLIEMRNSLENRFNQNLRSVAPQADAAVKDPIAKQFGYHQLLFDANGQMRTPEEYKKALQTKLKELLAKSEENYPFSEPPLQQSLPAAQSLLSPYAKQYLSGRPASDLDVQSGAAQQRKDAGMQQYLTVVSKRQKLKDFVNDMNFDRAKRSFLKIYDSEKSGAIYLGAEVEGRWTNQKGGEEQALVSEPIVFNYGKTTIPQESLFYKDPETGRFKANPNVTEFHTLMRLATKRDENPALEGIRFGLGGVKKSVPGEMSSSDYQDFKTFLLGIAADLKKPGETFKDLQKRSSKVRGEIYFQSKVGGDNKYHAFTIKFDPAYLLQKKFSGGTEEAPNFIKKNQNVLSEGFTIYIPAEISSANTNYGIKKKAANYISEAEALLNLNDDLSLGISNAGVIRITKNKGLDSITVGGYLVGLNPDTFKYDTADFENRKFSYDQAINIDEYITNDLLPRLQINYDRNKNIKADLNATQGVKDPKQLQQAKQ